MNLVYHDQFFSIRAKYARVHMLDTEPFSKTFGKKATRKKPNVKAPDLGNSFKKIVNNYNGSSCLSSQKL
jgi:hypothetical protein